MGGVPESRSNVETWRGWVEVPEGWKQGRTGLGITTDGLIRRFLCRNTGVGGGQGFGSYRRTVYLGIQGEGGWKG